MLVYVWARRNPYIRMNFFGLLTFNAPYLPWVLLGFSLLLGNSVSVDLLGMAVGHCYYFLEDMSPSRVQALYGDEIGEEAIGSRSRLSAGSVQ